MITILPLVMALALSPQGDDSVLATYDLRPVMPRWDGGTSWSQTLTIAPLASPYQEYASLEGSHEYSDLASFELLDLVTQILGEELRREGRELMVEGHTLTALAPPALHQQLRAILDGLASALSGTVPVRVDVVRLGSTGALPRAGVVSEGEAADWLRAAAGEGAEHESYRLELSAGRTAKIDAYRRIPFLYDYDVEIAQGMMIFAPIMSEAREGLRLAMRGLEVGDGLALSTVFLRSDLLGEVETRELKVRGALNHTDKGETEYVLGPEGLQSPEAFVRGLAFDSYLPRGSALVLTIEASLSPVNEREVLVVRRLGGGMSPYFSRAIPGTTRTLVALNAEIFRAPHLTADATPWLTDQGVQLPSVRADFDGDLSGFVLEWLKPRFSIWRRFGPWILIVTDPSWDRDAAAQLERLVKSVSPRSQMFDASLELSARSDGGRVPVRVRMPLLSGASVGLVVARGETAVTGYDVEVAQGASVADPRVSSVFDGLALAVMVDGTTCEAQGMAQIYDRDLENLDPGYAMLGSIALPKPRTLRFDERVRLGEGSGPLRIGGSGELGGSSALSLEIRVEPVSR